MRHTALAVDFDVTLAHGPGRRRLALPPAVRRRRAVVFREIVKDEELALEATRGEAMAAAAIAASRAILQRGIEERYALPA